MRLWFGWIPILTPQLMPKFMVGKLLREGVLTSQGEDQILSDPRMSWLTAVEVTDFVFSDQFRAFVRESFGCLPKDMVLHYLTCFDDQDPFELRRVALWIDEKGHVRRSGIFSYASDSQFESIAEITELDLSGLVTYQVKLPGGNLPRWCEETFARYHYRIVRDVYHEHIHHDGGDFALLPVQACSKEEALRRICRQFMENLVDAHKELKREIRQTDEERTVQYADYADLRQLAAQAMGQLAYCEQLHALFPDELSGDLKRKPAIFENGRTSLAILSGEIDAIVGAKRLTLTEQASLLLMVIAGFIAAYGPISEVFPDFLSPLKSLVTSLSPGCQLGIVGVLLLLISFSLRSVFRCLSKGQLRNRDTWESRYQELRVRSRIWFRVKVKRIAFLFKSPPPSATTTS